MGYKLPLQESAMTQLTELEAKALQGLMDSDYQDGRPTVGNWVWSWSVQQQRQFSGAMTSLIKKG